ncbi:hypothetical protein SAMN04488005_1141 [Yoonia tamlensis]|uniref:DUF192 domain-containing protein n=1 Tax=Yoonia tamlensis TaxID=390270 RepID=A0A1I6G684_9RHOB|nr:DUF192 domain-containing protein [Yoonia tamlensis]SFR37695.1 hypothetical protein SAMN04488005_1141 [Yoonia tamlensis]
MRTTLLAIAITTCAHAATAACAPDMVTVRGDFGQAHFHVSVADDNAERAQGLMFVEQMPLMSGMLFVYDHPQAVSFWMRNTLIPLDMLFVAPDGEIRAIHENAIPLDTTPIPGGDGIQVVLEINGGLSARLGIAAGDVLQHPAFGTQAILPCDEKSDD